jgi:cbb3-type cytochrome oxidase maturation protein
LEILGMLIPAALGLGLIGLIAFLWALRSGQFDDMDGAALRILIDDEEADDSGEDRSVKTTRSDQPPPAVG